MLRFASASAGWAARRDGSGVRIGEDDVAGADGDELVLGRIGGSGLELLEHGGVGQRDEVELALVQVVGQAAAIALGGQGELADDAMPVGLEDDAQVPFFHRRFVSDSPPQSFDSHPGRDEDRRVDSYEEACEQHRWDVPARYNIAADVCDKHDPAAPAMLWERYDGATRELDWGELQSLANQAAHVLRDHGVRKGDRVAVVLPPTPETAAIFFGTWKLGAILLSMSVLYGDDGIRHRLGDAEPTVLVTDAANADRFDAD